LTSPLHPKQKIETLSKKLTKRENPFHLEALPTEDTNGGSNPRDMFVEIIKEFPRFLKSYKPLNVNNFTAISKIDALFTPSTFFFDLFVFRFLKLVEVHLLQRKNYKGRFKRWQHAFSFFVAVRLSGWEDKWVGSFWMVKD